MIKVSIKKDNIIINGHSGYDVQGKDIVCAGVSTLVTTTVNAIIRIDDKAIEYKVDDGYVNISILKHDKYIDILIENMISLLKEMEAQYKKYIEIK